MDKVTVNQRDLKKLLDYCRCDEQKHYEETGKQSEHIYRTILKLDRTLEQEAV